MFFDQAISQYSTHSTADSTVDPIRLSNRLSLPFPAHGASRLGAQRSKRYDDFFFTLDEAEMRLRELASIMGMWSIDDDTPTAA
tara:strand:- start:175 stop:426 length:252 start_codon:yes stop_codon:yes gene_type:complete